MHQMEENGPRFFVPPNTDPIDPNYDPLIWRSAALLGGAMAHASCSATGHAGVVSNAKYDYYWPGFEDSAPLGHNTVCLLTEVASVDIASPVTVPATELRAGFKGLADYRPQINFPRPVARRALDAARHRRLRPERGARPAVRRRGLSRAARPELLRHGAARHRGRRGEADRSRSSSRPTSTTRYTTAKLEELLLAGGVEIQRALEPFRADGEPYPEGTDIILLAQPYRAYVKTLLERQGYPARRAAPDGPQERPVRRGRAGRCRCRWASTVITIERHVRAAVDCHGSRRDDRRRRRSGASGSRRTGSSTRRGNGGGDRGQPTGGGRRGASWTTTPIEAERLQVRARLARRAVRQERGAGHRRHRARTGSAR